MANEHTKFWQELLKFGDNEYERQLNWNRYIKIKYGSCLRQLLTVEDPADFRERVGLKDPSPVADMRVFDELAATHGGHPQLPRNPSAEIDSFMDFSEMDSSGNLFPNGVSFEGRVLIGASFSFTIFKGPVSFHGTEFLGVTIFDGAQFLEGANIDQAKFHGHASFGSTEFTPYCALHTKQGHGLVNFEESKFRRNADFTRANFGVAAGFEKVEFAERAEFGDAEFQNNVSFNDAKFRGSTSFRGASFSRPPKFFETELHEDLDFGNANWNEAQRSYSRRHRRRDEQDAVERDAADAVRAWDRLALIMSQRERLHERHDFFRMKMRAQRQRDGWSLLSLANWLFDKSSDYGWSVGQAMSSWIGHITLMWLTLTLANPVGCELYLECLLVSFANAHAFLGLASEGGYLHYAQEAVVGNGTGWKVFLVRAVGVIQAGLGPILLFLVLLTLRNRFRLG